MLNFIIGAVIGAIVMDFAWGYKLGLVGRVQLISRIQKLWSSK